MTTVFEDRQAGTTVSASTDSTTSTASTSTTISPPPSPGGRSSRTLRDDVPRAVSRKTFEEKANFVGSLFGSLALIWVLYFYVLPFSGLIGFFLLWFVTFVAAYTGLTALTSPAPLVVDRLVSAVVQGGALLTGLALASAVGLTFQRGYRALLHWNFITKDMSGVGPRDPLNHGGVLHAIVGSLIEIGIAVVITLPLGVGTAVYLTEVGGRFARVIRTIVEAMTALPSIVAGLFIYTVVILDLHVSKTGIAAALALSVMMLPIIARASDVVLRVVPGGLREASYALGATRWQTVRNVVLPTARPGLATALILGIARGIGETSPVLLTSGASTFLNANPFNQPMNSLPLFVYSAVRSGEPIYIERGFGAASVLLILVVILFVTARLIARPRGARR